MDYYGKLIRLINSYTVFDNVVIDASPEMISHYRLEHKTKDGSAFTQYKAAQALNFSDDKAISKLTYSHHFRQAQVGDSKSKRS